MTLRLIAAAVLLLGVGALGLVSSVITLSMVDEVNSKLPEANRFESLGWHFDKRRRLLSEYGRLYPDSSRPRQLRYLFALKLTLLGAAALVGLFP